MKILFLIGCLIFIPVAPSAFGQDAVKRKFTLFVSHLYSENKAILRRKAAPTLNIFSKLICFKKPCRGFIGWRTRHRRQRFKGYKDGGKVPRSPQPKVRPNIIDKDTSVVTVAAPLVKVDSKARNKIFILDEVLFEVNSAKLNHKFTYRLDSLVQLLNADVNLKAKISGHTDNTGSESYNLKLSKDRATAVAVYLVENNVSEPNFI